MAASTLAVCLTAARLGKSVVGSDVGLRESLSACSFSACSKVIFGNVQGFYSRVPSFGRIPVQLVRIAFSVLTFPESFGWRHRDGSRIRSIPSIGVIVGLTTIMFSWSVAQLTEKNTFLDGRPPHRLCEIADIE